jgi:hypothetical protein
MLRKHTDSGRLFFGVPLMAGDWIKVRTRLLEDPAVFRMSDMLGLSVEAVGGHLIRVWSWATDQVIDGNAPSVTRAHIDRIAGVSGMGESLASVGWITFTEHGAQFPNWDRHLAQGAKERALTAVRVARSRNGPSVTKTLPDKTITIDDDEEGSPFSGEQMQARIAALRRRPDWLQADKPWVSEPMAKTLARNRELTTPILLAAERVAKEGRNTLRNPAGCFLSEIRKALAELKGKK